MQGRVLTDSIVSFLKRKETILNVKNRRYRVPQKNAPIKKTKMAKHGRPVNIPNWSKGVQNNPNG